MRISLRVAGTALSLLPHPELWGWHGCEREVEDRYSASGVISTIGTLAFNESNISSEFHNYIRSRHVYLSSRLFSNQIMSRILLNVDY